MYLYLDKVSKQFLSVYSTSGNSDRSAKISTTTMAHVDLRQLPREQIKLLKPRRDLASVFDEFRIDDARFLEECEGRSRCCQCGQSRKYFCYTCCLPLERFRDRVPKVQLPFAVDIVKDAREIAGKSTAVHAPILAPGHVKLYTYPDIPEYSDASERVVLIFPGRGSLPLSALLPKTSTSSRSDSSLPFDRAVLVDCTWNQVKTILRDPRIAGNVNGRAEAS
ncbi:tRNA-uridine aminocarboxypropyltransferase 1 isoform X2 [Hyalella azteca]|uniref:tRNA-uridine aminocarboxypropyltransferase 1 n=2 Tax=Hyalella azteca TaxID=294128 RepID=A0A979FWT1_HYAAZ|nr:tRNA-uridine aminocarboxypropyltransferase 1 isoform X2 [Hyalella azteca]